MRNAYPARVAASALALWGLVLSGPAGSAEDTARLGATLAAHELVGTDGRTFRLADYRGEIVVVNFWATWCQPCRKELPLLDGLHTRLREHEGRVVAISVDRDAERATRFLEDHGLQLPAVVDGPEGLARSVDLAYLPYTIVLDRSGTVVYRGPSAGAEEWQRLGTVVEGLLTDRPSVALKESAGS
jgi:peroxiredoxin